MNPQILTALGVLVGMVLAIFAGLTIGEGRIMVGAALVVIPLFFAILAASNWQPVALAFFCLSLGGTLPLAKNLTPFNIIAIITFVWFVIEYVVFQKRHLRISNYPIFWLLLSICAILIVNFFRGGGGVRALGGETWGGRRYFEVYVAMAFYVVLTLWKPDMKALNKIPIFVLLAVFFDFGIWAVQYLKPGLIPLIYPVYAGLQASDIYLADPAADPSEGVERLFGMRTLGLGLVTFCVAEHNFKNLLSPKSLFYVFLIVAGIGITALAGFRSYVVVAVFIAAMGAFFRLKKLAIIPAIVACLFVGILAISQGTLIDMPLQVQRSMSFLPGNWDRQAMSDATGSTEWRQGIWRLWYDRYFPEHPIIGRGWNINPTDAFGANLSGVLIFNKEDTWIFHAATGSLHNGPLTAVDAVGILGTLLTIAVSIVSLAYVWGGAGRIGYANLQPIHRWVIINLTSWLAIFWVLDGFFYRFFPIYIVYCGLAVLVFSIQGKPSRKPDEASDAAVSGIPQPMRSRLEGV